jgi:hypothetical protein
MQTYYGVLNADCILLSLLIIIHLITLQKCPVLIPNHYRFLGLYNNSSRAKNQKNSNSELAEKYVIQASLKIEKSWTLWCLNLALTQLQRYGGVTTLNKGPGPVWNAAV